MSFMRVFPRTERVNPVNDVPQGAGIRVQDRYCCTYSGMSRLLGKASDLFELPRA